LLVHCGSGTYVRSLGRDIAQAVGTGAVMSALQRLAIGTFRVTDALADAALSPESIRQHLLSPLVALSELPQIVVSDDESRRLQMGQSIANRWNATEPEIAALDSTSRLIAIAVPAGKQLKPDRCFPN
jgi:tRNA pseudouridine55 synthase